jgi:hypothetical protein
MLSIAAKNILVVALGATLLGGCAGKSREALTGKAVGCSTRNVTVVPSEYDRKGMETSWCATCKEKRYQCVTNADRTRTVCKESTEGDGCG